MPVEIRELIIRAVVDDTGSQADALPDEDRGNTPVDTQAVIEECVRQVLKILRDKGER